MTCRTSSIRPAVLGLTVFASVLACSTVAGAQALTQYRGFTLGSDVAAVTALAGVAESEVKTLHRRPAVLQELEWRPSRWSPGSSIPSTDPVERITFAFHNAALYRITVDYGTERTAGMTRADLVASLSGVYGPPVAAAARADRRADPAVEVESGTRVSRWGAGSQTVVLYQRSPERPSFRLIISDAAPATLARTAAAQAGRLDEREAPQREAARDAKEREDAQDAAAKARQSNGAAFRP